MNPSNFPNDSRENLRTTTEENAAEALLLFSANEVENHAFSLGLQNQDVEMEERNSTASDFEAIYERLQEKLRRRECKYRYEAARNYALNLHSRFSSKKKEEKEVKGNKENSEFQKAKELIKKRREEISSTSDLVMYPVIQRKAPMLTELSMRVLARNSEAIKSLKLVPDLLKKKLSNHVSSLGKLDSRFMQLLIDDSPSEVCARTCVHLEEDDLIKIFCDCDRVSLKVLILDLCGRAMTDYAITEFLKHSPKGFPLLTTLSLQGAFALTDKALALISNSFPLLRFINLSNCSLLTFHALKILADKFGSTLNGLSIEGCLGINRFSSLYRFKKLDYLSVAGHCSVNNGVVKSFFMFCSSNLTDLSLANCHEVTDEFIWHIGRYCKKLESLDISGLENLTDKSLEFIAEGCKFLNSVILTRNRFSDEGVAAFLEVSGDSLNQLCLNKVQNVGQDTAFSLAKVCKRLHYLELSWCRRLTEDDLKRILSCCCSLRSLKLFGWTQVEDTFLEELSRSHIHIIGLQKTSLYAHLDESYSDVGAKFF